MKKTIRQLKKTKKAEIIRMFFHLDNKLIYYTDSSDYCCCFCIFKSLKKNIFQMIHNKLHHASFHWIYNTIVADIFIQNLSKKINLIYCSLSAISELSNCLTLLLQSLAISSWIFYIISYCHCWFYCWLIQNKRRIQCCHDSNLQILEKSEIHFWKKHMNDS